MLSLREYSKKRSRAEQTTRDYLARLGAKAMYQDGERVLSTGDMIRIEASLYLVECGLAVSTACRLVEMAAAEFEALTVDEDHSAWIVWRPAADEVTVDEHWIVHTADEAVSLMYEHDDAFILPIRRILRAALNRALAEAQAHA